MNYKCNHVPSTNFRIYYGSYNRASGKVNLVDISDSLSYGIFLESGKKKYARNQANMAFLVLINKDSPESVFSSGSFDASFELTATPVIDFVDVNYVTVGPDEPSVPVHNYNDGSKGVAFIAGDGDYINENATYNNSKRMIGDSIIRVASGYSRWAISVNCYNCPNTYYTISKHNTTDYYFKKGIFLIEQSSSERYTMMAYKDEYTKKDYPERISSDILTRKKFYLKDVVGFEKVPDHKQVFYRSTGSADTQQKVMLISDVQTTTSYDKEGKGTTTTKSYVNTDYSAGNLYIYLWLLTE